MIKHVFLVMASTCPVTPEAQGFEVSLGRCAIFLEPGYPMDQLLAERLVLLADAPQLLALVRVNSSNLAGSLCGPAFPQLPCWMFFLVESWMPIHSKASRSAEDSGTCQIIQWHPAIVETDDMLEDSLTLCVCCFELDVCCTWSNIAAVHVGI